MDDRRMTSSPSPALRAERGNAAARDAAGIWARATAGRDRLLTVPLLEEKLPGIESALALDRSQLLIARIGGEGLAFVLVVARVDSHEVLYLSVDPAAWGTGLARQILEDLRQHSTH